EYYILSRGWGAPAGFLVAWSRMTVIQTGSLAILAYVFGDYVSSMFALGSAGPPALAAGVVVTLTAVNVTGLKQGRWTQYLLTGGAVAAMCAVIVAGLLLAGGGGEAATAGADVTVRTQVGRAMIFVLLAYGGWSEGAYVSAEIGDRSRGVGRVLLWGTGAITLLYVLVNAAYLNGLGLEGVAASDAVAAELLEAAVGPWGARVVTVAILLAALSSANATVITGARSNYAMGRDWSLFSRLGRWSDDREAPVAALLLQGGIALVLVGFGAVERSGFQAMVDYTAPIFWLVLLFTGLSVIVLRRREPEAERPYRVPLYPLTPLLFAGAATYMLYSSVRYAGDGALLGLGVMLAGVPFVWLSDLDSPHDDASGPN
ncbi:MAG: APC family permease, partial [Gemmatimonadota bacterium]